MKELDEDYVLKSVLEPANKVVKIYGLAGWHLDLIEMHRADGTVDRLGQVCAGDSHAHRNWPEGRREGRVRRWEGGRREGRRCRRPGQPWPERQRQ